MTPYELQRKVLPSFGRFMYTDVDRDINGTDINGSDIIGSDINDRFNRNFYSRDSGISSLQSIIVVEVDVGFTG
jgi:hypothetical protein